MKREPPEFVLCRASLVPDPRPTGRGLPSSKRISAVNGKNVPPAIIFAKSPNDNGFGMSLPRCSFANAPFMRS